MSKDLVWDNIGKEEADYSAKTLDFVGRTTKTFKQRRDKIYVFKDLIAVWIMDSRREMEKPGDQSTGIIWGEAGGAVAFKGGTGEEKEPGAEAE